MTWQSDHQYATIHLTITVGTFGGSGAGGGGAVAPGAGQALAWLDAIEVGADTRVPVSVYPYMDDAVSMYPYREDTVMSVCSP